MKMKIPTIIKNFEHEVKNNKLGLWEQSVMLRILESSTKICIEEGTYILEVNKIEIRLNFKANVCVIGRSFLNYLIFPQGFETQTGINVLHFIIFGM